MASLKNHILVPIDFSEQSLISLSQSYNLSRLTKATLTLLHVIEEPFQLPFFSSKKAEEKGMEKKIQKELDKLAIDVMSKVGVKVETLIARGKVYEEIQKTAKKLKCSFIVMGTKGSRFRNFIGSNALRVIRESPCPVITIHGKRHRPGCKHIVLPLDMTKETKEKVTKAIEIARLFGSIINLVTILTTDDEFIVNKLKRQMDQVYEFVVQHDVSCTVEYIFESDVSDEIIKYSKKIKADLILIMTQQEMNWTNMFISSEAQEIINSSEIPVMSVRPVIRKNTTLSVLEY